MDDPRDLHRERPILLVTGIDRLVGANLALRLSNRFRVTGVYQELPVSLAGCQAARCPASDPSGLVYLARDLAPHWIVHCGSIARASWDFADASVDPEVELRVCDTLVGVSRAVGSRLTVLSTDAVFAGPRMFQSEDDEADGCSRLAETASQVEQKLRTTEALVVRTHAYGWAPSGCQPGFAERVWQALSQGEFFEADPHHHATPLLAADLADLLARAYRRGLRGLYHIAGAERVSAYRFACHLASVFGLPNTLSSSEPFLPEFPEANGLQEASLQTRRARSDMARSMPMLCEGLERFADQTHNGFRAALRSCNRPPLVRSEAA
ncbi:MAG: sugar nucleotide-binding protein [Pirellulales bacterium]|nr:sugar nucleotide-binding protein [Pirellulales bacterium]